MRATGSRSSPAAAPRYPGGMEEGFRAPTSPTGPVVLALFESGLPTACLRWAARLSCDTGSWLHVVRVLPKEDDVGCALDAHNAIAILRSVERTLVSHRATSSWMRQMSSAGRIPGRFSIVRGDFVTQVARYVEAVGAQLLLLPPQGESVSEIVAALSARTRTPVLVSRAPCSVHTIIAATDLRDAEYPVLRFAGDLGRRLDTDIIAVHNLEWPAIAGSPGASDPADVLRGEPGRAAGLERLCRVSQQLLAPVQPVVRDDADPVDAILDEARTHDANLVVIGLRSGREGITGSVAARVVDLTQRSVLVIPMQAEVEP